MCAAVCTVSDAVHWSALSVQLADVRGKLIAGIGVKKHSKWGFAQARVLSLAKTPQNGAAPEIGSRSLAHE